VTTRPDAAANGRLDGPHLVLLTVETGFMIGIDLPFDGQLTQIQTFNTTVLWKQQRR
jgi:hypothetical protein